MLRVNGNSDSKRKNKLIKTKKFQPVQMCLRGKVSLRAF